MYGWFLALFVYTKYAPEWNRTRVHLMNRLKIEEKRRQLLKKRKQKDVFNLYHKRYFVTMHDEEEEEGVKRNGSPSRTSGRNGDRRLGDGTYAEDEAFELFEYEYEADWGPRLASFFQIMSMLLWIVINKMIFFNYGMRPQTPGLRTCALNPEMSVWLLVYAVSGAFVTIQMLLLNTQKTGLSSSFKLLTATYFVIDGGWALYGMVLLFRAASAGCSISFSDVGNFGIMLFMSIIFFLLSSVTTMYVIARVFSTSFYSSEPSSENHRERIPGTDSEQQRPIKV
eukprot:g1953.t1